MNSELILQSDVLDILFDKRNKLYGAYSLRKFYPNRVKTSLLIMLGGVALLSAFTLMPTKKITPPEVYITTAAHIFSEANPPKKQASPKQKTKTLSASQKFISKLTIVTEKDSTDFLNDLSKLAIAGKTTLLAGGTPPFESGPQGGEDVGRKAATIAPIIDYSKPLNNPDVQGLFGRDALTCHGEPPRPVRSGDARQATDATGTGQGTYFDFRQAVGRASRCKPEIARQRQLKSTAESCAMHRRDDGDGHVFKFGDDLA